MQKRGKTKVEKESEVQVNAYKDTIDAFFDGWETNCNIDSFDTLVRLLNTYPPQYIWYAEKELVKKDPTGRWYVRFARDVTGADVPPLQAAVIDKDPTGELCYLFASEITGADVPQLQAAILDKDPTGAWCYRFARDVAGADVPQLQQAVIEKDTTGEYLIEWIQNVVPTSLPDIVQALVVRDKPVPPLLAREYPESLELYKKLQVAQKQDVMCEP